MNSFYLKLKENLGLSLILAIGLGVEFSNFQAMFFRFMTQYRPDWGAFNHLPAICLSAFLLLCIVIFGIRKQTALSWFLAMLTCVISFSVYSRMNLSWEWENMNEVHFVILILSGMLPMLVAYTTHQIAKTDDGFYDEDQHKLEGFINEIRKRQLQKQQNYHQYPSNQTPNNKQQQHNPQHFNFEEEPVEMYKQKVSYDRNVMIRPEKVKNEVPETHHCEECGNAMEGKRKGTKYCSKDCSVTAQKRRRNQQYEESVMKEKSTRPVANPVAQRTVTPNHYYNSAEFDNNSNNQYTFDVKPANKNTVKAPQGGQNMNNNVKIDLDENMFTCENCGKPSHKRSHHSRYCSEVCRISALRAKRKSDFFVRQDDFEANGFIEWANPEHTA